MFLFGLTVGLVIGAVGSIFVYRNNQAKFNEYIDHTEADFEEAQAKIKELEIKIEDLVAPKSQPQQSLNNLSITTKL